MDTTATRLHLSHEYVPAIRCGEHVTGVATSDRLMSAVELNEDILIIETPERVPLHFALASIGNRFLACAIDHGIQGSRSS